MNEWSRLISVAGLPDKIPGLAATATELTLNGLTPHALGAVPIKTLDAYPVPTSHTHVADVSSPTAVDILAKATKQQVCGAQFTDAHPREWLDALAQAGVVALLVTPEDFTSYPSWSAIHGDGSLVLLNLAIRAWPTGVGITSPASV